MAKQRVSVPQQKKDGKTIGEREESEVVIIAVLTDGWMGGKSSLFLCLFTFPPVNGVDCS
jgi:hypothetical protein